MLNTRLPIAVVAAVLIALAGGGLPSAAAFSPDRDGTVAPVRPTGPALEVPSDGAPFTSTPPDTDPLEDGLPPDMAPGLDDGSLPADGDPATPLPEVHYGDADLPGPVRDRRAEIIAAARSGDPEALRPLAEASKTTLSPLGGGDPVDILVAQSGDHAGIEILSILLDVLDAGWVRLDVGTPRERYVWPYFAEFPPERLDARQMVEVFRLLTAGDFEDMRSAGTYVFYRVEIGADGRWQMFMSGE